MKKFLMMPLLLASVSAQANELDNLVNTSAAIVGKIDTASIMVGSAINYSGQGLISPQGIGRRWQDNPARTSSLQPMHSQALQHITLMVTHRHS